jgi:long-chain acyl-CoA synthetase
VSSPVATPVSAPPALGARTLCEALMRTIERHGAAAALRSSDGAVSLTYAQLGARVARLAAGLHALGVRRGDAVGLMLVNRPEFHLLDAAAMLLGATPFSVYATSPAEQVGFVVGDAGARVLLTERRFLDVVRAAAGHGAQVERLVLVDDEHEPGTTGLAALEAAGDPGFDLEAQWRAVEPGDVLTLIYTSGTTGPPKGVELTHANVLAELRGVHAAAPLPEGGRVVSFLPAAHIADRWSSHYSSLMAYGREVTCVADAAQLMSVVAELRPEPYFGAVPRVWEKLKAALEALAGGAGLADAARADPAVGATVRERLGLDRAQWFVTGAAPTPVAVLEFFAALGIDICEVWGMSELSCIATTTRPGDQRYGSVGRPLEGVEVRLGEGDEVLVRGGIVMAGYRGRADLTGETVDREGWLHSGDVGRIDEDGFLWIVDRKKELIINAAGKNMSPANIEAQLKAAGPLIGQAMAVGDGRPYNVALIVLDPDGAAGLDPGDPELLARVQAEVDAANAHLSRVEQIKAFTVLEGDWTPGGEELTPTMKLRRRPIAARYAQEIDALYAR